MKKVLCLILSIIMLLPTVVFAYDKPISVTLDGEKLTFDVEPALIDGRTMVPIRAIFEAMGAVVEWDNDTQSAICTKGDTIVKMTIDSPTIYINDVPSQMDTSPVIINGRTLAPARFVAESFGYKVEWDNENAIAKITSVISNDASEKEQPKADMLYVDILDKSVGSFYIPYQSGDGRWIEFQHDEDAETVSVRLESKVSFIKNSAYSKYYSGYENIVDSYAPGYYWLVGTMMIGLRGESINLGDLVRIENFYSEYGMPINAFYYEFTYERPNIVKNINDTNESKDKEDISQMELKRGEEVIIQYRILTDITDKDEYPMFRILYEGGSKAKYMHLKKGTLATYRNTKYTKPKPQVVQLTITKEECETKILELKNDIGMKKEELNDAMCEKNENKAIDIQNKINALELELKKYEDYLKTLE